MLEANKEAVRLSHVIIIQMFLASVGSVFVYGQCEGRVNTHGWESIP